MSTTQKPKMPNLAWATLDAVHRGMDNARLIFEAGHVPVAHINNVKGLLRKLEEKGAIVCTCKALQGISVTISSYALTSLGLSLIRQFNRECTPENKDEWVRAYYHLDTSKPLRKRAPPKFSPQSIALWPVPLVPYSRTKLHRLACQGSTI